VGAQPLWYYYTPGVKRPSRATVDLATTFQPSLHRGAASAEALAALQSLFTRKREVSIYLTLRAAAQASGAWAQLYPQLTGEVEQQVLADVANRTSGFPSGSLMVAVLLGYADLLEGRSSGRWRGPCAPTSQWAEQTTT